MPAYYLEALTVALGLFLLMGEAFGPSQSKKPLAIFAALGLAGILITTFFAVGPEAADASDHWQNYTLWNFYQFDPLARFYKIFALVATLLVVLMSIDFRSILARFTDHSGSESGTGEYYALPVLACAGMMWMASARDLVGAFVALELVTITFYILVAYLRHNVGSLEAGVKYLILGALSTGFLVYGIAWIYGATGTMNLAKLQTIVPNIHHTTALLFGIALVLVALGFKVGAAPMQIWIPDVYQGAPTPTTAFLSVGSKAAGFILLIRFLEPFLQAQSPVRDQVLLILLILAIITLLVGNLAAIAQSNFKRLLAYSSISHAGFILLALSAGVAETATTRGSTSSASLYLATYLIMTMGCFFLLSQLRVQADSDQIDALNGLGKRNPAIALGLTVIMAGLAGVPLTVGFFGKLFVFSTAYTAGLWAGIAFAVIGAAAGFYYYFKVIRAIWWLPASADAKPLELPTISRVCFTALAALVLILGITAKPIEWLLG